ncbi:Crp/Fnr family transcriptional regulator, partial [Parasphingorhabdus sp.]
MTTPIGATGFIKGLPADVRNKLLERGQLQRFAKGQLIQQRGDKAREFWYVKSGYVQIGRYGVDGQLTLFALLGPTETFGELAFLGNFDRTVDAIAGSDAELFRIGQAEFQSLIDADASAARLLLQTMAHTIQQAFDLVEAGRSQSVPQRLALVLLQLHGNRDDGADIRITQQEL